ncbi:alpha-xylosidase [Colletotrichum orchidophilum]|uniref:Alpha-xylosidase n=1 Tax=Colletotrichum orchidophilum TaxID=1209926 RepID=A0A1G4BHR9_9PEZI|nr:alpha-xylosidase [Colletotrichum orchidophilum]OHF00944.1 alpha-xylosidase [Colletotrichum orchidophilum]
MKALDFELAHRNSQASMPFALSSLGYGILQKNPSIALLVFGKNTAFFGAYSTNILNLWVVVANTPAWACSSEKSGARANFEFKDYAVYYDPTSPRAHEHVWNKAKQNYFSKGIRTFWFDQAEPKYSAHDFGNYRYFLDPSLYGNIVNLFCCAWTGGQKHSALVCSGDVASSWGCFRNQLAAGLRMGMVGLTCWMIEIGGLYGTPSYL